MTEKNRIGVHVLMITATLFLVASISYGQTSNTATAPTPAPTVGSVLGQVTFKSNCGFLSGVGSGVGIGITFDGKNLWYSCYNSKLATVSATDTTPAPNDLIKADPKTGAVIAGYNIQGGTGAIAYDQKRNVIWAAEGDGCNDVALWGCDNQVKVITIPLDNHQNVVIPACATPPCAPAPLYTVAFSVPQAYNDPIASTGSTQNIVDGLAIDTLTDTLYIHYDFGTNIFKYNATTGLYLGSVPNWLANTAYATGSLVTDTNNNAEQATTGGTSSATVTWNATTGGSTTDGTVIWTNRGPTGGLIAASPGIPAGTPVIPNPYGAGWLGGGLGCVVSGLAIGGSTLFEGSDYCDHVWAVNNTTQAASFDFDFKTAVSGFSSFDSKTLTCDPKTFKTAGDVVWVKEPYDPQTAFAFMIPTDSCGVGGKGKKK